MVYPIFSIITVTYNAVKTVEQTIKSVLIQDVTLYEYIIIDGGSTDGTVDCIKKYRNNIAFWSSEKDNGIYDVMNKGIDKANGKWIIFLGADDRLKIDILKQALPYLNDTLDLVYGNVVFPDGKRFVSTFNIETLLNNTVHHQGAFYNKRLFNNFRYNTSLKAMSDYELNLVIYLFGKKRKKIEIDIAECDKNGISSSKETSLKEINIIRSKYFNVTLGKLLCLILKIKYFLHYNLLHRP